MAPEELPKHNTSVSDKLNCSGRGVWLTVIVDWFEHPLKSVTVNV